MKNNEFQLSGTIKFIIPTLEVTEEYSIKEFGIVQDNYDFPEDNVLTIKATNQAIGWLDNFEVGDEVTITYRIKGYLNKKRNRYYNSLDLLTLKRGR